MTDNKKNIFELKFKSTENNRAEERSCDCSGSPVKLDVISRPAEPCCRPSIVDRPNWAEAVLTTTAGPVIKASTNLTLSDYWDHFKCRTTSYRNNCKIAPGLYAVGSPDKSSEVLVSANYKYSFDLLRRELHGINAWILVLDTKGINVWCAAGKGTFGTDELIKRISSVCLEMLVDHRRIIVPQLGAVGISAFRIKQATGFRVIFGPVYAKDIPAFILARYKATKNMRQIQFDLIDRFVLTPMEIRPAMRIFLLYAAIVLLIFGLDPSGIIFKDALIGGLPFLILGLSSIMAGSFITPILLPFIPFRSFAVKGWLTGLISTFVAGNFIAQYTQQNVLLSIVECIFFPVASSYLALQFTGSTTFTGMSGVKKELKIAVPIYLSAGTVSVVLLMLFKLYAWNVI
ncbi:MAG TPA: mercury methylation corrinoid protein HgcA [Dissulfurispiraceae bacterium]|nr:mercury methylation corrinoid protein HgcA [Dissulfurispiraceae bacterium]